MSDETLAVVLTLTSFGLLLYTYVGYPALLWLLNRVIPAPESMSTEPAEWPQVSIILSAYNEENVIADRLKNLLDLDYPRERLEILVGSDGSTDRTCEIVNRFNPQGIRLVAFKERRGKASVVNDLVAQARGDIAVSSTAAPASMAAMYAIGAMPLEQWEWTMIGFSTVSLRAVTSSQVTCGLSRPEVSLTTISSQPRPTSPLASEHQRSTPCTGLIA